MVVKYTLRNKKMSLCDQEPSEQLQSPLCTMSLELEKQNIIHRGANIASKEKEPSLDQRRRWRKQIFNTETLVHVGRAD